MREDLLKHIGGTPTAIQQALIDRAAWASLHLSTMDSYLGAGREVDEPVYLQWTTTLMFALAHLNAAPRSDISKPPKWERTGPPLPAPPGATREDRTLARIELQTLCCEASPKLISTIAALLARLERYSRLPPTPARARKYVDMAHRMSSALDELGRWKLVNTMIERATDRHRSAAALVLADMEGKP